MKRLLLSLVGLLVITSILFVGCGTGDSQSSLPSLIYSLNGSGDETVGVGQKTSEVFHISQSEWYIESTCEALDSAVPVVLTAMIYPKGESIYSMNFLDIIQMTTSGTDRNYLHEKGDFYIKVIVMNVKTWTLEIYQ